MLKINNMTSEKQIQFFSQIPDWAGCRLLKWMFEKQYATGRRWVMGQ